MDKQAIHKAEKIDRFLQGKMTHDEQKAFEYQLAQDTHLRETLEKTDMARQAIRHRGLRLEVKAIRERMLEEDRVKTLPITSTTQKQEATVAAKRKSFSFFQYSYRIAAGIALVFVSFVAIQMVTVSPEDLYASKIELDLNSDITRGREETSSQTAIQDAYRQNNFEETIEVYKGLNSPSLVERYFAAAAYLQLGQYDDAIQTYQQVIANARETGNEFLQQEASYKLALTYVRQRAYDEALPMLEELNENYDYYDQLISNSFLWKLRLLRFKDGLFH